MTNRDAMEICLTMAYEERADVNAVIRWLSTKLSVLPRETERHLGATANREESYAWSSAKGRVDEIATVRGVPDAESNRPSRESSDVIGVGQDGTSLTQSEETR